VQLATPTPEAEPAPWKPNSTDALAGTALFQDSELTEVPLSCPFHRFVIDVPLGMVSPTVHFASAADPAVTLTVPVKPPAQEFVTAKVPEHVFVPVVGGTLVDGTLVGGTVVGGAVVGEVVPPALSASRTEV
jgi:hypothetical protein